MDRHIGLTFFSRPFEVQIRGSSTILKKNKKNEIIREF
jgi:hypothetical protein